MMYTLPDGRVLDTELITQVSSIRDLGQDERSIDRSILSFSVYLRKGETVQVVEYYHYTDWAEAKKRLTEVRKSLCDALNQGACQIDEAQ